MELQPNAAKLKDHWPMGSRDVQVRASRSAPIAKKGTGELDDQILDIRAAVNRRRPQRARDGTRLRLALTRMGPSGGPEFRGVFLSEHHLPNYLSQSPNILLAAMAMRTSRLPHGRHGPYRADVPSVTSCRRNCDARSPQRRQAGDRPGARGNP